DRLNNVFRFFLGNALLYLRPLSHRATRRRLDVAITQRFQRHASPHELLLQNVVHVTQLRFVLGCEHQLLLFERDVSFAALEIEALAHFLHCLVDGVHDLCPINLRDNIKGILLRHLRSCKSSTRIPSKSEHVKVFSRGQRGANRKNGTNETDGTHRTYTSYMSYTSYM